MSTNTTKITNAELGALGVTDLEMLVFFSRVANGLHSNGVMTKEVILDHLEKLLDDPMPYTYGVNGRFKNLALYIIDRKRQGRFTRQPRATFDLRSEPIDFQVFGADGIEPGAYAQMETAMKLPITVAGALMPDAHQGYGLPIGGVMATTADTIIPYAVGVDIACRMCLSIFELPAETIESRHDDLRALLMKHTYFGMGAQSDTHHDSSLFDKPVWSETRQIRALKTKAYRQLGTSGTGNHFVEWGELIVGQDAFEGIPAGRYLSLLSHSGSRGFGGSIATHYSGVAMKKTLLPHEARHLAWLDLNSEEGQEYWIAMNLAGEYASANHREIHDKIAKAMQFDPLMRIENHHNFAWKERLPDGTEVMVHRKGATPAGENVLGIIPGSMSAPGFVVRGKGMIGSIDSASHGAGRVMSRKAAFRNIDRQDMIAELRQNNITLIGSDLDEAPMAYKNIHDVMKAQEDLVETLAEFRPRIVRMANPKEKPED